MTPLLDVQNISKAFGAHVLFENISFSIAEGQHVGLIAKNGTGKSTLLSLLSGKESVDSGSIIFRRDIKVGFLEQQPKFDPEESVLDACFNHQGDPDRILKAKQILTQLHITDLTQGGTRPPMDLYVNFRGRKPTIDALLRRDGIKK